jgi:hypothetical protein
MPWQLPYKMVKLIVFTENNTRPVISISSSKAEKLINEAYCLN